MSEHTISHADVFKAGAPYAGGINGSKRGVLIKLVHQQLILAAPAGDVDGIAAAQAVVGAGDLDLSGGAFTTDGIATIEAARNVAILSSNAGDTTQTATVTGRDLMGNPQVEDIAFNGTTEAVGAKAFSEVSNVAIDAALAGNASVGTSVTLANIELGLDVQLLNLYDVLHQVDGAGAAEGTIANWTVADVTSPATATTGDTKGTFNPATLPDGAEDLILTYIPNLTKDAYGENFSG